MTLYMDMIGFTVRPCWVGRGCLTLSVAVSGIVRWMTDTDAYLDPFSWCFLAWYEDVELERNGSGTASGLLLHFDSEIAGG